MNKHLLKLVDRVRFTDLIPYPSQEVIFEQFAGLIIQDCIKTISSTNTKYGDYRDQITTSYQEYIIQAIKDKYK